eukprot:gene30538-37932_t
MTTDLSPIHPGEILREDFLEPFGITQNRLATIIGVPPRRINEIVHGKRSITADTALRLAKAFGNSAQFWLNIQDRYELDLAADKLDRQVSDSVPRGRSGALAELRLPQRFTVGGHRWRASTFAGFDIESPSRVVVAADEFWSSGPFVTFKPRQDRSGWVVAGGAGEQRAVT